MNRLERHASTLATVALGALTAALAAARTVSWWWQYQTRKRPTGGARRA